MDGVQCVPKLKIGMFPRTGIFSGENFGFRVNLFECMGNAQSSLGPGRISWNEDRVAPLSSLLEGFLHIGKILGSSGTPRCDTS